MRKLLDLMLATALLYLIGLSLLEQPLPPGARYCEQCGDVIEAEQTSVLAASGNAWCLRCVAEH